MRGKLNGMLARKGFRQIKMSRLYLFLVFYCYNCLNFGVFINGGLLLRKSKIETISERARIKSKGDDPLVYP